MGGINVKNTMVEVLMQNIAPHLCLGCGKTGVLVCDYCKYNIVSEPFVGCILCGVPHLEGICIEHNVFIKKSFVVSTRTGVLEALIDALKFQRVKAAAYTAAELLHESLPTLPPYTVIVPIPTVHSHIRERGYDQVLLIARHFAKLRNLRVESLLVRDKGATQHKLARNERLIAARQAFLLNKKAFQAVSSAPKLIIDDIITTGSTVKEAARLLASEDGVVMVGALAYQP